MRNRNTPRSRAASHEALYCPGGGGGGGSSASQEGRHAHASSNDIVQSFLACIKVFCTSVAPCYALPWVRGEESHTTGSGFAVRLPNGERKLVCHAQVLENYALVQVRRVNEAQKYVARVECVGYDVDVAVLQVDDEHFWRAMPVLTLTDSLPPPMSEVVTAGFPAGGEELATTRGIVNRILLGGNTKELCLQMDAIINPGYNGGPVFNVNGHLVGMACSGTQHAAGYILPMPVMRTFFSNAAMAKENGHEYLGKS